MTDRDILLLILGMTVVTYIPRALPAFVADKLSYGPKLEKFLGLLPYTAMAALIFPGVLSVDSELPVIGIAGALAAALLAWKKAPVIVCVLAAIALDIMLYIVI